MDLTNDQLQNLLVGKIARVFFFEYWARFYFTTEIAGNSVLEVPEEVLAQCRRDVPDLFPLLEKSNHALISAEESQRQVGAYVLETLDEGKGKADIVLKIFDSKPFRIELHMFSLWIKGHETYLDEKRLDFAEFIEHYRNWRKLDQVREFVARLEGMPEEDSQTTH
ncbi:hypothetical protein JCM15519_19450 [Fundidesulfovibrio butyratiphilus]